MSLLLRAALLGGIAYLITRSLSNQSAQRRSMRATDDDTSHVGELHPGESNIWPTSDAQQRAAAAAGPSS